MGVLGMASVLILHAHVRRVTWVMTALLVNAPMTAPITESAVMPSATVLASMLETIAVSMCAIRTADMESARMVAVAVNQDGRDLNVTRRCARPNAVSTGPVRPTLPACAVRAMKAMTVHRKSVLVAQTVLVAMASAFALMDSEAQLVLSVYVGSPTATETESVLLVVACATLGSTAATVV